MALIVQKYGGTSVGSLERIQAVASHIQATALAGHQVVVAVSAMGAHTDELLQMAQQLSPDPHGREVDMLLTAGERISMALLAIALHHLKVPSVSLTGSQSGILTDDVHGNARIDRISGERIRAILAKGNVAIVAGFQGVSPRTKEVTTLGRGGTDLTAIALAAALGAQQCEIYKDVDGVCTADPRLVSQARVIPQMSWNSLTRLAWNGASVLHARGVHVAAKYRVPLEIRSSFNLSTPGTKVMNMVEQMETATVTGLAHKERMVLLNIAINGAPAQNGIAALALEYLWSRGESPLIFSEVATTSGLQLHLLMSQDNFDPLLGKLRMAGMSQGWRPEVTSQPASSICIVGHGFRQSPELSAKVRSIVGASALYFEVQNDQISMAVESAAMRPLLNTLHTALIGEKG